MNQANQLSIALFNYFRSTKREDIHRKSTLRRDTRREKTRRGDVHIWKRDTYAEGNQGDIHGERTHKKRVTHGDRMVTHFEKINIMEGPMWRGDIHKKRTHKEKKRIASRRGGDTRKKDTRREDIHKIGDRRIGGTHIHRENIHAENTPKTVTFQGD